jgi:hypothetical protein
LRPWGRIGFDFGRPPDGHRVTCAAKVRGQQLGERWQVERRKGSRHMEQEDGARVSIAYLRFAEDEVRDKSPLYCELLRGAASDPEVIGFLLTLAREKRQPNLFLAATRDCRKGLRCGRRDLARRYSRTSRLNGETTASARGN